jgi:hypothetical protein
MADYYSLLARKIDSLPQSTPQGRQAIYELARKALVNQLRAIQPPVADQVIQNEGRALDEAIARLEAEVAPAPAQAEAEPKAEAPPPKPPESKPPEPEAQQAHAAEARREPPPSERLRPAAPLPPLPDRSGGSRRLLFIAAALVVTVGLVALAALHFRERPEDLAKLNPNEAPVTDADRGKLSARVGGDGKDETDQTAQQQQAPPVARRAALLVGPRAHPDKPDRVYDGSVIWRLENISGDEGAPVQPAIRGDIDFPDARVKAMILIQKNQDATLSASHTITINFSLLPGSDIKAVKAIGALQTRRPDTQSGERLIGIPVPTTENSFLMGLMRGDSEKRNIALLKAPTLIDIPLQLSDDRIATVNLEKGASGDRVFQDAITAWTR